MCAYMGADAPTSSSSGPDDDSRHPSDPRGLQLPGAAPGGPSRHSILRPSPGAGGAAHDPVLEPSEAERDGADDDQRARPRPRNGYADAREGHPAAPRGDSRHRTEKG